MPGAEPVRTVRDSGTVVWLLDGTLHRLDGPAIEQKDGRLEWWVNGQLHRVDSPAVTQPDGYEEWWLEGRLHRIGGPTIVNSSGTLEWYENGYLHRIDGPAVEGSNGAVEWWLHGQYCDWTSQQGQQFLALPLLAREFVSAHVTDVRLGRIWSTWEDLFTSAAEVTVSTPRSLPHPPAASSSVSRGLR